MTTNTQFGRQWAPEVPRGQIEWLVARLHVSTPDRTIEANMRRRCRKLAATPEVIQEIVDFAILAHAANRDLFAHVMGGR